MSLADPDHKARQLFGIIFRLHESAVSALDVQQNSVGSGSQLLAHDAGCDQAQVIYRSGHIPQCVDLLVSRCNMTCLTDDRNALLIDLVDKILLFHRRLEAGDRTQLIDGPAGKAQTPSAHLGDRYAACCRSRSCDEGRLVAYTSGAVLVHFDAADPRKIHRIARLFHIFGQKDSLFLVHALKIYGHEKGRHLIIGDITRRIAVHHVADLFRIQRKPVPFFRNDVNCVHCQSSCFRISSRMLSPI